MPPNDNPPTPPGALELDEITRRPQLPGQPPAGGPVRLANGLLDFDVPTGWVRISSPDTMTDMLLLMGNEPPKPVRSDLGWKVNARPKQTGAPYWIGPEPDRLVVSLLIGSWTIGESIESFVDDLESLAARPPLMAQPPQITLDGALPIPTKHKTWVIESLEQGDDVRYNEFGHRVLTTYTATFMHYVAGDELISIDPVARGKVDCTKAHSRTPRVTFKKGDTLQAIARKYLGSADCWKRIKDEKNRVIRDPGSVKVGDVLRLP